MLNTVKEILRMAKSRSIQLKLSLVLSVFESMLIVVPIIIAFQIIGSIPQINPATSAPLTMDKVSEYIIIMVVCLLVRIVLRYGISVLRSGAGYEVLCEQRKLLGSVLRKISMGFFNQKTLGDLVSTITTDASFIELYGIGVLEKITNGALSVIIGLVFLAVFDYRIALLVGLLLIPIYFLFKWVSTLQDRFNMNRQEQLGVVTEDAVEYIKGLHVLKTYNMTNKQFFKTKVSFARLKDMMLKLELSHVPPLSMIQAGFRIITIVIILLAAVFTATEQLPFQSAVVLMISSFSLFSAVETMGIYSAFIRLTQIAVDRINQIKDIPKMDVSWGRETPASFDITFENVSFAYDTKPVLTNISFTVPEKSMTALVGLSGSGKTTIVNLIARFWDISCGKILIGGKDIKTIPYDFLLKNMSFVFQDVFLFNDTVLNNIRIGNPNASMDAVVEAARRAGCHDFITQMQDGYNTMVGEGGTMLSGGERQRISIARALMKDAPIVLLDEVTANIDVENEQSIQQALQELLQDRTVIKIAHKLSTLQNVDQILVLQEGGISQVGQHTELAIQEGLYKTLWDMQYQTSKWKF